MNDACSLASGEVAAAVAVAADEDAANANAEPLEAVDVLNALAASAATSATTFRAAKDPPGLLIINPPALLERRIGLRVMTLVRVEEMSEGASCAAVLLAVTLG